MTEWEWYNDINTKVLFLHLLLTANHEDKKWKGIEIKRGQTLTSLDHLSREIQQTKQQTRTSLNKLKSTREITIKTTNKYTLITIVKYSDYQDKQDENNTQDNTQDNTQITNKQHAEQHTNQQTNNKQITTNKNNKNNKEEKKKRSKEINKEQIDDLIQQNFSDENLKRTIYDFIEMRKTIDKPMTVKAVELLIKKLYKLTNNIDEQIEILNNSIMNTWQGIFPLKNQNNTKTAKGNFDDFKQIWKEANIEDEQKGNGTNNNPFGF